MLQRRQSKHPIGGTDTKAPVDVGDPVDHTAVLNHNALGHASRARRVDYICEVLNSLYRLQTGDVRTAPIPDIYAQPSEPLEALHGPFKPRLGQDEFDLPM